MRLGNLKVGEAFKERHSNNKTIYKKCDGGASAYLTWNSTIGYRLVSNSEVFGSAYFDEVTRVNVTIPPIVVTENNAIVFAIIEDGQLFSLEGKAGSYEKIKLKHSDNYNAVNLTYGVLTYVSESQEVEVLR